MLMLSLMILLRVASASIPEITVVAALQLPASLNSATCCSGNKNGDELKCGYPLEGGDRLARSSAALGDIDGDGIPDVAVGSSRDGDGAKSGGAVYILHLNRDGTVKNTQKISAEFGMADKDTLNPLSKKGAFALEQEDRFGYSVGRIGGKNLENFCDIFCDTFIFYTINAISLIIFCLSLLYLLSYFIFFDLFHYSRP